MNDSRCADAMERLRRVPDEYRTFTTPASEARRRFGFDDPLLAELIARGLPHRGTGPDPMFDRCDLDNLSTGLGLASPQLAMTRRWAKSLHDQLGPGRGHFELRLSWRCPQPGHDGACDFRITPGIADLLPEAPTGNTAKILVEPVAEEHQFGSELDQVVADARGLFFHSIPTILTDDLAFARITGLADCRLAARYLAATAQSAGLTVRIASGFFIGVPFPTQHTWLEFAVGERWVAADPFYLHTVQRWGLLPDDPERLWRSPRNVLWRLDTSAERDRPIVQHAGSAVPLSIGAQWRRAGS